MSTTRPSGSQTTSRYGFFSAAAGVLAVVFSVLARMLMAGIAASEVNTGHPEFDWTSVFAPVPGYICAILAVALGIAGLRHRDKARMWAIVGTTIGMTFLIISLSEIPAAMITRAVILEPMVR